MLIEPDYVNTMQCIYKYLEHKYYHIAAYCSWFIYWETFDS